MSEPKVSCTWVATHDHMPGANLRLSVQGTCTCPTPGYTLGLKRKEPQGINPKDLLLEFDVIPPGSENQVSQVESDCKVEFTEDDADEYDTVTILGDSGDTVQVSHVH